MYVKKSKEKTEGDQKNPTFFYQRNSFMFTTQLLNGLFPLSSRNSFLRLYTEKEVQSCACCYK